MCVEGMAHLSSLVGLLAVGLSDIAPDEQGKQGCGAVRPGSRCPSSLAGHNKVAWCLACVTARLALLSEPYKCMQVGR